MSSGSFIQGSTSVVGPVSYKVWNGGDNPPFIKPGTKWKDLPTIGDPWGNVLTPEDDLEYRMALIAAKGTYLRISGAVVPDAENGYYGLHAYSKTHNKAFNSRVYRESDGTEGAYGAYFGSYTAADPWTSNDDLKLIEKLRERILHSDLHAGVALVEIDRAMKMARDDFVNLHWAISSAKKGDFRGAVKWLFAGDRARKARESSLYDHVLRNAADRHLVWTYGYSPLIHDVDAAMRYTAWKLNASPIARVTALRRLPMKITPSYPFSYSDPDFTYGVSSSRIVAYLRHVDQIGLVGLLDIPSALWERTIWSFVLDWAIPIQSYLSALNTVRSLTGRYVVTRKIQSQWRPAVDATLGGSPFRGLSNTWWSEFKMDRTITTGLDVPFPTLKPAARIASAGHALNAVSLLTQQAGKKFRFL